LPSELIIRGRRILPPCTCRNKGNLESLSFKPWIVMIKLVCLLWSGNNPSPAVTSEGKGNIRRVRVSSAAPCFDFVLLCGETTQCSNTTSTNNTPTMNKILAGKQDQATHFFGFLKHPGAGFDDQLGTPSFVTSGLASRPGPTRTCCRESNQQYEVLRTRVAKSCTSDPRPF
jgi:hypothetical protein